MILHWFSRPWAIEELLLVCCHGTYRSERSGRMEGRKQKIDNVQKNRLKTILTALPFPLLSPACRHLKGEISPASFFLNVVVFFFCFACIPPMKWKFFYFINVIDFIVSDSAIYTSQCGNDLSLLSFQCNFKEILYFGFFGHKQSYFSVSVSTFYLNWV